MESEAFALLQPTPDGALPLVCDSPHSGTHYPGDFRHCLPLHLLRRGPGGREPLAVRVGETMFALRLLEARCILVEDSAENLRTAKRLGMTTVWISRSLRRPHFVDHRLPSVLDLARRTIRTGASG